MKRKALHYRDSQKPWLPPETTAFAASYVATACGIAAVALTVDHSEFTRTIFFLLTAGYLASFSAQMEHLRWGKALRTVATMVGLGGIPVLSFFVSPSSIFPIEALAQEDLRTAVLLAWLAVIISYLIGSYVLNRWVPLSFPIVPSLSMFGVIATMNPNTDVIVAFMVFVCAAIFLVSYENTVRQSSSGLWTPAKLRSVSYQHFVLAGGFFLPVIAIASALTFFIQWITPPSLVDNANRLRGAVIEALSGSNWAGFYDSFDLRAAYAAFSHTPRMVVYAKEGFNWRGRVYNRYDGGGWQQSTLWREAPRGRRRSLASLALSNQNLLHHESVDAEFECRTVMPKVLYSPGMPLQVSRPHIRIDLAGSLQADSPLSEGTRYRVSAAAPMVEQEIDALRQANGSYPDDFRRRYYLQLPTGRYRLRDVATEIVKNQGLTRPYEKAEALIDYLHKQCKYSLTAPRVPALRDAAEFFVLDSRRGACDMFATALALMCRAVDVPARVVTGYARGEVDPAQSTQVRKAFVVKDSDAHAWVEIYINPEWDWIPLDPSAGTELAGESFLQRLANNSHWIAFVNHTRHAGLPVTLTAVLLWCALQLFRQPKTARQSALRFHRRLQGTRGEVCQVYQQMCKYLRRHGWSRSPFATPSEFLEAIGNSDKALGSRERELIENVTSRLTNACYSERPVSEAEVFAVKRDLRELRRILANSQGSTYPCIGNNDA